MGALPSGTVTFVFTDIEDSTRRWQANGSAMGEALARHDSLLAECFERAGGRIFKHTGDGMCAAFPSTNSAVEAAVDAQRRLAAGDWDDVGGLPVRMGVHTGEVDEREGDYFGPVLNRVARIMAAGHGGQVLVSSATASLLDDDDGRADGVSLRDLGLHELRDLSQPERLFQLVAEGMAADFPPPRTGVIANNNLPLARSSFVGRSSAIDEVRELFATSRVVTLVGIGGTGKTRLALEVAARVLDDFDSVWLVELGPIADGRQIPSTIATAIGLALGGVVTGSVLEAVATALDRAPSLLVLDNCEHLVDDCADLVDELLARCSDLKVLATSREALSLEGERTWPVPSLPADDAVDLFVDRARAVAPNFEMDDADGEAVAEICRRLDGIPLAIELAASRVAHLSPVEIAARLDDRFRLLTGGHRRRAQRQQTLQGAIDWSHDLLDDGERRLLRRLSVFSGGCTLAAAEDVCTEDAAELRTVVDVVGALVTKSLVVVEHRPTGTRYGMLETIRLYAADRLLEAGETERFRDRHRDHFLAGLERHGPELLVRRDLAEVVEVELDNLRVAIDWSEAQRRFDLAARLAIGTASVWSLIGHHEEGQRRLRALAEAHLDLAARARVLAVLSHMETTAGDFVAMRAAAARSLELAPEGPLAPLAHCYVGLAQIFDRAGFPLAHESFAAARRIDAGNDSHWMRELADSVEAQFFLLEGEYERVVALADAVPSAPSFAELNLRNSAVAALIEIGDLEAALKQVEWAEATLPVSWTAVLRAIVLAELGRCDEAAGHAYRALEAHRGQPFPLARGVCLVALAAVSRCRGDDAHAVEILESMIAERGLHGFRSPAIFVTWLRHRRAARAALDPADYEAAKQRGRAVPAVEMLRREAELLVN